MVSPRPRAFAKALARAGLGSRCETCGASESDPPSVILLVGDEKLGQCSDCGNPLAPDGKSLGGSKWINVIYLDEEAPAEPPAEPHDSSL